MQSVKTFSGEQPDPALQQEILEQLSIQAAQLTQALAMLSKYESRETVAATYKNPGNDPTPSELKRMAANIYASRRKRDRHLDKNLMGEPAWDMMLDLYVRQVDGKQTSITSACIGACAPPTTALRWITVLENRGLLQRYEDAKDGRRANLELTKAGYAAVSNCMKDYVEMSRMLPDAT